ncbi:hypothetical protein BDV95DRAFT_478940 [Massariosphaeria phaeospora]|uniref:Uncharacterized protein n=1 Tax=Massariosphaeria phaeospora TaxID=100035 RepID=A0A7C8IFS3_9PLEO|nr:hypothetical protein BDV95DRAFT_478940 [Massariosphaeria phaeospora]
MAPESTFTGPWSKNLEEFKKSVASMPDKFKSAFDEISRATATTICNLDYLHVWETDSDLDNLLQLTQVIGKIRNVTKAADGSWNVPKNGGMVIIAEDRAKEGRDNYTRLCELVKHLTGGEGKKHLDGTACAFGTIVVVKGFNTASTEKEADSAVRRITKTIERVFEMAKYSDKSRKLVWHHSAFLPSLLTFINTTTPTMRSSFAAITITDALSTTTGIKPTPAGKANSLVDLQRLEEYCTRLAIPAVFVDAASQLISYDYLATYMYFHAYYLHTFLPPSLSRPHLHAAQDQLLTWAFRLRGASESKYGADAVKLVQQHLKPQTARAWARMCVDAASFERQKCKAAASDAQIHHAVQLADSPFAPFTHGVPAFARLAIGPAGLCHTTPTPSSSSSSSSPPVSSPYTLAPLSISFSNTSIRPSSSTPFRLLLPAPGQDVAKVTSRIQGTMMAVLERVRQEKGMPRITDEQRGMWSEVGAAVNWAVGEQGLRGKSLPEGVLGKVGFVTEKVGRGTWGFVLGLGGAGGGGAGVGVGVGGYGGMQGGGMGGMGGGPGMGVPPMPGGMPPAMGMGRGTGMP